MDRILIRDLRTRCIVGIREEERHHLQDVTIQVDLFTDLGRAGRTDRIEDTVDYHAIKQRILARVEPSQFFLVEALAQAVADICLEDPRVLKTRVQVEKPSALRFARTVGVRIVRRREPPT